MTPLTSLCAAFGFTKMLNNTHNSKSLRVIMLLALYAVCGIILTGCMSAANNESDLPWNTPQSWEGSMSMPGMNGSGGF